MHNPFCMVHRSKAQGIEPKTEQKRRQPRVRDLKLNKNTEFFVFHPLEPKPATLTAVSLRMGLNPGEDMDICECIVPSQHGGTLNSRRDANPLVRLVGGP
ncbi:hypothetical protein TNCV_4776271 [Trichonephila clavipes]|nr:hypothetical protein TNCV_4776271 [Trichonephila clavipes]